MDSEAALRVSQISLQKAQECQQNGNLGRAFAYYLLAIKLNPSFKDGFKLKFTKVLGEWTSFLCEEGRDDDAWHCFSQALEVFPENDLIHDSLAIFLTRYGPLGAMQAVPYLKRCLEINQWNLPAIRHLENVCNLSVERWHFRMLNDNVRNEAFKEAIFKKVKSGLKNVLDVGTGTSLLSLFAAEAGADAVYACDSSQVMMRLAHQIVDLSGFTKIKLIGQHSTDLKVPESIPVKASLLVCELLDCGLFGEHVLETLVHAWRNLLEPDAKVIPHRATFHLAAFEGAYLSSRATLKNSQRDKLTLDNFNVRTNFESYDTENLKSVPGGYRQITNSRPAVQINFNDCQEMEEMLNGEKDVTLSLDVIHDGRVDCMAGWFSLQLDEDITLDTGPSGNVTCWDQAIFFNPSPLSVAKGQVVEIHLTCVEGEIKVDIDTPATSQKTLNVSPGVVRMLNDEEYTCALEAGANSLDLPSNEDFDVLDLSLFPLFGLKLMERCSGNLWVTCLEEDQLFVLAASRAFRATRCLNFVEPFDILSLQELNRRFDVIFLPAVEVNGELNDFYLSRISEIRSMLKPGGLLLPSKVDIIGQVVDSDWLPRVSRVLNNEVTCGFEVARFINEYSVEHQLDFHMELIGARVRSETFTLVEVLLEEADQVIESEKTLNIVDSGAAGAIVYWYKLSLGQTTYTTRSAAPATAGCFSLSAFLLNQQSMANEILAEISHVDEEQLLFVGIFSAPENFEKRHSLRKTWLLQKDLSHTYKFIVGQSLCRIAPIDRTSPYGCQSRRPISNHKEALPFSPESNNSRVCKAECSQGFAFHVLYDMEVTHLGLPSCLNERQEDQSSVRIRLMSVDGKLLASSTLFNTGLQVVKPISAVAFPRHSEGILLVENVNGRPIQCCKGHDDLHNAATTISGSVKNSAVVPYENTDIFPGIMFYTITENPQASQGELWERHKLAISRDVQEESKKCGDILFVNTTDFYRNLPQKLIKFLASVQSYKFKFLLKTDDDTFIDLRRLVATLRHFRQDHYQLWWWSSFKEYWHVPRTGKWREENFKSITYPPFPCGGGYVLSRGLVDNLTKQSATLETFQGEDVSLGIWLAGVKKLTQSWSECRGCQVSYRAILTGQCERGCEWTCSMDIIDKSSKRPKCNRVQLSVSDMYSTWQQYKLYGTL